MQWAPAWFNRTIFKYIADFGMIDRVLRPVNEFRAELGLPRQ